jgi:hypothetical protein
MANKKRIRSYYKKKLGRYRLNRSDIIAIEKLLRIYSNAYEKKKASLYGHPTEPTDGRRHMPRRYADMHVKVGRFRHKLPRFGWLSMEIDYTGVEYIYNADSVKFLPKSIKKARYFQICCSPGMEVTFSPFLTTVGAQTNYATGEELRVMKGVVSEIEKYLLGSKKSFINIIKLEN